MSDPEKRLAVYLCDAGAKPVPDADWASVDADSLLARLRRNKVPLIFAQVLRPSSPIWSHPAFQQALADEQASLRRQRAEFAPVRAAMDAAGIPTSLIKSAGIAPSFPYRSDNVDLLVPPDAEQAAARALYSLGYVELRNIEEPRKFLFKRFLSGREVSAIHLHTQVGWGTGFLADDWLWDRVRPSDDDTLVSILCPEDELLVTLAHAFYEDKEFKVWDLVKARHCAASDGFDWNHCARQAGERGWLQGLNAILDRVSRVEKMWWETPLLPERVPGHEEHWAGWEALYAARLASGEDSLPSTVPFAYSKRHYFTKVAKDRALSAGQKWDDALRHSLAGVRRKLKVRSQRPLLIALSGADGSGKTTHAEALRDAFGRCDIRARIVWSRGASSPFTDALIRTGKRWMGSRPPEASVPSDAWKRRAGMWRRPVVRRLWPWVLALDLWRQYAVSIAWPLLRGWVVIADRYVADAQAEVAAYLEAAGEGGVPVALRLLERVSPKPALRFLLDVPADVAALRKEGQESADFIGLQTAWYRRLAQHGQWHVADAARPAEVISSEIVRISLLRYYRRFRTFLNGLFLFNPRARRPFLERY